MSSISSRVQGDLVWFDPGIGYLLPGEVSDFSRPAQVVTIEAIVNGKVSDIRFQEQLGQPYSIMTIMMRILWRIALALRILISLYGPIQFNERGLLPLRNALRRLDEQFSFVLYSFRKVVP